MMRIVVILLLLLAAHFTLTPFAPAAKAWIGWPFAATSRSWLGAAAALPQQPGAGLVPILAGIGGLCLIAAALSLLGWLVPAGWFRGLALAGAGASVLLYLLFIGPWAILPLLVDAFLLWGLLLQKWTVALLRG